MVSAGGAQGDDERRHEGADETREAGDEESRTARGRREGTGAPRTRPSAAVVPPHGRARRVHPTPVSAHVRPTPCDRIATPASRGVTDSRHFRASPARSSASSGRGGSSLTPSRAASIRARAVSITSASRRRDESWRSCRFGGSTRRRRPGRHGAAQLGWRTDDRWGRTDTCMLWEWAPPTFIGCCRGQCPALELA